MGHGFERKREHPPAWGIANDYANAWHEFDNTIGTFEGTYYEDLRREQISQQQNQR